MFPLTETKPLYDFIITSTMSFPQLPLTRNGLHYKTYQSGIILIVWKRKPQNSTLRVTKVNGQSVCFTDKASPPFVPDQSFTNTSKKRMTFSRFLRGLKTSHRKEKHGASSPRHGRATTHRTVPQRVSTFSFLLLLI